MVLHVVTRDGVSKTVSISPNSPPPITQDPLIVMVNKNSASASEILAGALHDNRRAKLIGGKTFGKGKMQNVFELGDGGALFVTGKEILAHHLRLECRLVRTYRNPPFFLSC